MSDLSGTLRKVILDGTAFDVMGDTNVSATMTQWEVSMIPTSGDSVKKMTRRPATRESVIVKAGASDAELLKDLGERLEDFPMSYETAAGDVYRTTGAIEFETHETEENRATIQMLPRNKWDAFVA